jgi:dTDP-4-dehydrorhamnose 3,5-epimerase
MATVKAHSTQLPGVVIVEPAMHADSRGFFQETYRESVFAAAGIPDHFVQDNHSRSARGVIRGLHAQGPPHPQAKLIRCARGAILDVVVDIRRGSPTFGRWEAWTLDDQRGLQLYCPSGFAHGFQVLSEVADVVYRCSDYYDPASEFAIAHDDPAIGIQWADIPATVSERDQRAPLLSEIAASLPFEWTG